jgi:hypothetical protein
MTTTLFNRRPYVVVGAIDQPPQDLVKATPSLWQADLETAALFGGELTRHALGAMKIRGDKKYVVVDSKVHLLMPGQCPAIPGWHTDGAPRTVGTPPTRTFGELVYSPLGSGPPNLAVQEEWDAAGDVPRFHLLVTGDGCLTEFLDDPLELPAPESHDLYRTISAQIAGRPELRRSFAPSCTVVEWDWWNLHQGIYATRREFRFLIRVTESDYHAPQPRRNLDQILRSQQMVYSPTEFGW